VADDYEYTGLLAQSWDLLRGDTSQWPDRVFYREAIRESGEPALDVGCGTGRLLLDYLEAGVDVDGVDVSPEMLELCRKNARALRLEPRLYEQPMEALDLPRRYRTIFVPSSSFQLLVERELARAALRRFAEHLVPGGRLIMPFMVFWRGTPQTPEQTAEWRAVGEARRSDGALIRRFSRARYDLAERLEHSEDRYEVVVDGEVTRTEHHTRSPSARWYTLEEATDLLHAAGYTDLRAVRGFEREPATERDRIFTVFASRPPGAARRDG
jgi:SAM-dependent methyltransferase